ncbi:conjugal transfer protein TraR [candidate division WOR-3 bacterium 4484_100]|uniref:Conjugal transfer protein TraR n=1 Tax=candidate division WOR-3 bacterium 4484_100 TaxID=1936077 RepID=A0A1V4QEG9_UNCW3|nr:MAG: conjugal transfer protein TraR [candidate division WOR-3 bacterium 4484_100]
MAPYLWIPVFLISLYVLIKASEYFTRSAETLGISLGIPNFIVGVTIVAFGTSLPEIVSSIFAVVKGSSEIVLGNVVGSNITNIFLIVGCAAVLAKKMKIKFEILHIDLPFLIASAGFLSFAVWDGTFTRLEALLSLLGILVFILYAISTRKGRIDIRGGLEDKTVPRHLRLKTITVLVISGIFIYLGGKFTIDAVIKLSQIFNIGKEIIGASAVALGTSLPELIVSITAVRQGKPELAIGNVLGSNVFNAFAVMGIPGLVGPLVVPQHILHLGIPMLVFATLLFFFMIQDKEITRWEGFLLLIFYAFFLIKLFLI